MTSQSILYPYHRKLNPWLLWSSLMAKLVWLTSALLLAPDPMLHTCWVCYKWVGGTLNSGFAIKHSSLSSAMHLPCKLGWVTGPPKNKMKLLDQMFSRPHTALYLFLRILLQQITPNWVVWNRNLFSPNSRGQKLKIKVSADLALSGGFEEESFSFLYPKFW